jgi:hypothetical protein
LEAALRQGMRDISANLQKAATEPDTRRALRLVLEEVMPLDERRLAFARVHGSFMAEAMVTEHLRPYFSYNYQAWRSLITKLIEQGCARGEIHPAVDADWAADMLAALIEALRMRVLFEASWSPAEQRRWVARWIDHFLPAPSTEVVPSSTAGPSIGS